MSESRPLVARHVRGPTDWQQLSEPRKEAHYRALRAVSLMRGDGLTLSAAARLAGTTPRTVHRYADPALTRSGGRYRATLGDRLYRRMTVYGPDGCTDVDVRGSRVGSLVGGHHNAIGRYLATGDPRYLAPFVGKRVGGVELLTDIPRIEELAARRELDIDDIYPRT